MNNSFFNHSRTFRSIIAAWAFMVAKRATGIYAKIYSTGNTHTVEW